MFTKGPAFNKQVTENLRFVGIAALAIGLDTMTPSGHTLAHR